MMLFVLLLTNTSQQLYLPIAPENEHDIKLMDNLQKQTHSDYCCRKKSCCFGFPKPPATKTLMSQPLIDEHDEIMENAKSFLQTVPKNTYNSRCTS